MTLPPLRTALYRSALSLPHVTDMVAVFLGWSSDTALLEAGHIRHFVDSQVQIQASTAKLSEVKADTTLIFYYFQDLVRLE